MTLHLRLLTVGAWQENCYLLVNAETNEGLLVDPGGEPDRILSWAAGVAIRRIILTHAHQDHLGAAVEARAAYGAPIVLHPADWPLANQNRVVPDYELNDGETYSLV